MSLRFRKSLKLGPGLRLNIGKKGLSVSAGTRGARVTMGTHGTRVTTGLPGTGISYSKKLGSGSSHGSGNMTKRQYEAELRRIQKDKDIKLATWELQNEQVQYEKFTKIAKSSPRLLQASDWEEELVVRPFIQEEYGIPKLEMKNLFKEHLKSLKGGYVKTWLPYGTYGSLFFFIVVLVSIPKEASILGALSIVGCIGIFLASLFFTVKWYLAQRAEANKKAELDYTAYLNSIDVSKRAHPENERVRIEGLRSLMAGDETRLENQLEDELDSFAEEAMGLEHSFKTEISFEIVSKNLISLDVDLPEIEDVAITDAKKVLKSGKVSEKEKSQKIVNSEYASGVIGMAFNVASHVFNVSPSILDVIISGYTQRTNKKTGNVEDDYIYSVKFNRVSFSKLNLREIDPVEAVTAFELEMELSKAFEFKKIEPLSADAMIKVG